MGAQIVRHSKNTLDRGMGRACQTLAPVCRPTGRGEMQKVRIYIARPPGATTMSGMRRTRVHQCYRELADRVNLP